MPSPNPLTSTWLSHLTASSPQTQPLRSNYCATSPSSLVTIGRPTYMALGTGASIFASTLVPVLEATERELLFVTCFWARSESLDLLNGVLRSLSEKVLDRRQSNDTMANEEGGSIRVRIHFSSQSLWQKLMHWFHADEHGLVHWDPSTWTSHLGLPAARELRGLDIRVSSFFALPFSVAHPKFVVVDRRVVGLMSCNVSWENWFEGVVMMEGEVVAQFVRFWGSFWGGCEEGNDHEAAPWGCPDGGYGVDSTRLPNVSMMSSPPTTRVPPADEAKKSKRGGHAEPLQHMPLKLPNLKTLFLPSPHSLNPRFHPFPWQSPPPYPPTPLNTFLIAAIDAAHNSIYLQTPNLTSPPVLDALKRKLRDEPHVSVRIVTSERLMVLEQLVTAGTTTARCIKGLVEYYKRLCGVEPAADLEAGGATRLAGTARLKIEYYEPKRWGRGQEEQQQQQQQQEPLQSHFKLSVFDGELVVLGSGNLDRASWYTSQELGIAVFSADFADAITGALSVGVMADGERGVGLTGQEDEENGRALSGRLKCVFDSEWYRRAMRSP